jgi:site-specific recombinase XerD
MKTATAFSAEQQQFSAGGKITPQTVLGSTEHASHRGAEPVLPTPDAELSISWQAFLTMYEHHLEVKGRTPTTIRSQRSTVRLLGVHACADDITEPSDITKAWLTGYLVRPYGVRKPGGCEALYAGIKAYWQWWSAEEELPNPMAKIERPKAAPMPDVDIIKTDDLGKLLAACPKATFEGRRNRASLLVLWQGGLRRMELSRLDVSDVDTDTGKVAIRKGKNGKYRVTRVGPEAVSALLRYRMERDARVAESAADALFISVRGPRLTPGRVAQVVAALGRTAGVSIHTHQLRHTWTDSLLRNGVSETAVCQLAGWSDTSMLFRYGRDQAAERALREVAEHLPKLALWRGRVTASSTQPSPARAPRPPARGRGTTRRGRKLPASEHYQDGSQHREVTIEPRHRSQLDLSLVHDLLPRVPMSSSTASGTASTLAELECHHPVPCCLRDRLELLTELLLLGRAISLPAAAANPPVATFTRSRACSVPQSHRTRTPRAVVPSRLSRLTSRSTVSMPNRSPGVTLYLLGLLITASAERERRHCEFGTLLPCFGAAPRRRPESLITF